MKITIIVGNGFDMSLGLDTSYQGFYKWYLNQPNDDQRITRFKNEIKNDLENGGENWSDFELGLGKYTEKFSVDTVEDYLACREDAVENIRKYLLEQASEFHPEKYTEKSISTFKESIWQFFCEAPDAERDEISRLLDGEPNTNREITFVSFNYTDILEQILSMISTDELSAWKYYDTQYVYKLNRNIIYVHGTTERFPILGVNDKTQIANTDLLKVPLFKDILFKADCVSALGQLWHNKAEQQISDSQFVCVLGMSIGGSDAKWWRKLVQWLKASTRHRLIIYWYEKNGPREISVYQHIRCTNDVKDRLISFSNLSDSDREQVKKQISVVINTKRFLKLENYIAEETEDSNSEAVAI